MRQEKEAIQEENTKNATSFLKAIIKENEDEIYKKVFLLRLFYKSAPGEKDKKFSKKIINSIINNFVEGGKIKLYLDTR